MSKIVLDTIASGYDLSKVNSNFEKIATELNEKVLYRNAPSGEPNTLEKDLDTNGKKLLNLPSPTYNSQAVPKSYVDALAGATEPWIELTEELLLAKDAAILAETNAEAAATQAALDATAAEDAATAAEGFAASINPALLMAKANNLSDVASVGTARTNLGLGTAATLDVGTTANKVVQLDNMGKLPAVDGSNLINLPSGGASGVASFNTRTGAVTLTSGDVTTALGFTPPNGNFVPVDANYGVGCFLLGSYSGSSSANQNNLSGAYVSPYHWAVGVSGWQAGSAVGSGTWRKIFNSGSASGDVTLFQRIA